MTDPIADMLTRIRNANHKMFESVSMGSSKMKVSIAEVLKTEGFISEYAVEGDGKAKTLTVQLKYKGRERTITNLKRVSKPGLRVYCGKDEVPRVLGGMGISILSTPKGIMAGKKARAEGVGGEVLCYVW